MAKILIVDDDPTVREYLSIMVRLDGHHGVAAENGEEAIALLSASAFDLAIVDIFMPVKEGIETIMEMRRRFPVTKIVAMSAGCGSMASSQALDYARNLGADDVLPKPFSLDDLHVVMTSVLHRVGHAAQSG